MSSALGLGLSLKPKADAGSILRVVTDGLKLYMPYKKKLGEVRFVGTGSTSFDGSDDYIDCGVTDIPTGVEARTMMIWVYQNGATGGDEGIFGWGETGGSEADETFEFFNDNTAGVRVHYMTNHSVGGYVLTPKVWTHICATYDGVTTSLYVNGVLDHTDAHTCATKADFCRIGSNNYSSSPNEFFDGSLKNAAIWSRALTATEVQNVMYKSYGSFSQHSRLASGLVSWWALDADSLGRDLSDGLGINNIATWNGYGGNSIAAGEDNSVEITYADDHSGFYSYFSDAKGLTTDLTVGAGYQISFDAKYTGGSAGSKVVIVGSTTITTSNLTTSYVSYEISFTSSNATTNHIKFSGLGASNVVSIKNIVLKEVQVEDLKSSNDGTIVGAIVDEDLYGGDTPVIPRGIDNAPTVQADAIGAGSASFNGSSDNISLGNDSSLQVGTSDFSVTAWVYRTADDGAIFGYGDTSPNPFFHIYENATEQLRVRINDGGGDTNMKSSASSFAEDKWTHIAVTIDRDSATGGKIYFDGIEATVDEDDFTSQQSTLVNGSVGAYIGARASGGSLSSFHAGNISQVGLWNRVLTQAEIQSVMEKTFEELTASEKTNLVSYWALDKTDGNTSNVVLDKVDETLGSELIVGGTFEDPDGTTGKAPSSITGWTVPSDSQSTVQVLKNAALFTGLGFHAYGEINQTITTVAGKMYKVTLDYNNISGNSVRINADGTLRVITSSAGQDSYTLYFVAGSTSQSIIIRGYVGIDQLANVDNVSVKLVNGNVGLLA